MTAARAVREALRGPARLELARRSMIDFCALTDEDYDPTLRHAKKICEHLDALASREIENLAIFMPPQNGKSYHVSQRFPAYLLGRYPKSLVATTSYTIDIAQKNSRAIRDLVEHPNWPFRDIKVKSGANALREWYTTAGGGVKAAGVGGSLTGFGAHLACVDDPLKGMAEANSLLMRENVWEWYQTTLSTRARARVQKLLAQTRWHDDDLGGRILSSKAAKSWTVLTLRSYAEEDDILGRAVGELLWPNGPRPLSVADGEISSRAFAALYQQRPLPAEGAIFKVPWFTNRYRELPELRRAVIFVDGAWKEGVSNDRSAIALWGTNEVNRFVVDAWAGRVEYPDLKRKLIDYWERWRTVAPNVALAVEDAASGIPIIQEFRRDTGIPVIGVKVDTSKTTRAEAATPMFEASKVLIPDTSFDHGRDVSWVDEWVNEHLRFPAGAHDDWVDTTSGAHARLAIPTSSFGFGSLRV